MTLPGGLQLILHQRRVLPKGILREDTLPLTPMQDTVVETQDTAVETQYAVVVMLMDGIRKLRWCRQAGETRHLVSLLFQHFLRQLQGLKVSPLAGQQRTALVVEVTVSLHVGAALPI